MQKILNNPKMAVDEMLEGYIKCHKDTVEATKNPQVIKSVYANQKGRVGLVSGGGSGHNPAFLGYLGWNMLDVVAVGRIFTPPTVEEYLDAFRIAHNGAGVACLHGNFERDVKNIMDAIDLAEKEGIRVKRVAANDNVASAPLDKRDKRKALAGEVLMWKIGGAAAALGYNLDQVIAVSQEAVDNTRSMGVGLSTCKSPEGEVASYDVLEDTMEIGVGYHGEPGIETWKLKSADHIADMLLKRIVADLDYNKSEVAVMVSGLGATTEMELYILYNRVYGYLEEHGINIYRAYVGDYLTSLDMKGATITLMKLNDTLKTLLDFEADSAGFHVFNAKKNQI